MWVVRVAVILCCVAVACPDSASADPIVTIAGSGTRGFKNHVNAQLAELNGPSGVAIASSGDIYVADTYNNVVRRVDHRTGAIANFAGAGWQGFNFFTADARVALMSQPTGVAISASGDVLITDTYNHLVRRVEPRTGTLSRVAGTHDQGFNGRSATDASLADIDRPIGIAASPRGDIFFADAGNRLIRKVDAETNELTTVAGSGNPTYTSLQSNGPLDDAQSFHLSYPGSIAFANNGDLFIADTGHHAVIKVDHLTQRASVVAGTGVDGFNGQSHTDARLAQLSRPSGIAISPSGDLYIADSGNDLIRRLDLNTGALTTFVGIGKTTKFIPHRDQDALSEQLIGPTAVAVAPYGLLFTDRTNLIRVALFDSPQRQTLDNLRARGVQALESETGAADFRRVLSDLRLLTQPTLNRIRTLNRMASRIEEGSTAGGLEIPGLSCPVTADFMMQVARYADNDASGLPFRLLARRYLKELEAERRVKEESESISRKRSREYQCSR